MDFNAILSILAVVQYYSSVSFSICWQSSPTTTT